MECSHKTSAGFTPNPAREQITIQADEGIRRTIVYDLMGRAAARASFGGREAIFNISRLPIGVYIVAVDGKRQKLVKAE